MNLKSILQSALILSVMLAGFTSTLFSGYEQTNQTPLETRFFQSSYTPENLSAENFTVIVLPDTQGYSKLYPWIFDNQTQWIVDNVDALSIVFVTHLGDLVDQTVNITQWENANRSMSKLDNSIPWAVLPGNHDMFDDNLTNFNTYFGYERFSEKAWYGGAYNVGDNANSYHLFSAGGNDYLILQLQYDPNDDILYWANEIIDTYPNRKVVVATHDYLMGFTRAGQRSDIGERIWHSLVKPHADQIFLVLCGHSGTEDLITDNVDGHIVYQMLADYQNSTNIESGWLRILEFSPSQEKIFVKTYSPMLNIYKHGSLSEYTIDYKTGVTSPLRVEPPDRENTVYIRADGSVEPSSVPIRRDGDIYVFEDNISGSLVVERDNVVIDGAGFTLRGTGAKDYQPVVEPFNLTALLNGITPEHKEAPDQYLTPESKNTGIYSYADKLTVKNLKITEFWSGIEIEYSSGNCIVDNEITNNTRGVWIHQSSNDIISGNTISENKQGITLTASHDSICDNNVCNNSEYGVKLCWSFNNIFGNNITSNCYGVSFEHSSRNVFRNNSFSKNTRIFYNSWSSFPDNVQNVDTTNTVDQKPIYYWNNKEDMTVPADAGWVALVNSTRIRVENLNLAFGQEILLVSTKNSTITNNVLTSNDVCVYLEGSSNNNIIQNTINDNRYGIHLKDSFNNNITHNSLARNDKGIYLYCSSGNCIQQNELVENIQGIDLFYSTFNQISTNTFDTNEQGISFNALASSYNESITAVYGSANNSIVENDIINNECGICVSLSSNNTFSGNNFVNNTNQVLIEDPSDVSNQGNGTDEGYSEYAPANAWDNGKLGNYWSDYQEEDNDSDCIGDTPYVIDENNKDNYPSMQLILLDSSPKDDSLNQDPFSQLSSIIVGFITSWAGQLFLAITCFVVGLIAVLVVAAKRRRKLQNKQ